LFASKLGITLENAELLKQALKEAAINEDVVIQKTNEFCRGGSPVNFANHQ